MDIIWRPIAVADLGAARRYIAERNPRAAARVARAIDTAVEHLAAAPNMGRPGRVHGTRELVVPRTPYIVVYEVLGDVLQVLAVLHGAREWPDRF